MTLAPLNAESMDARLADIPSEDLSNHVPAPNLLDRRQKLTRIFQIGFNKCGTRSLYRFLQRNGIYSAHFNRGLLALRLHENIAAGRKPLHGKLDRFVGFTDVQRVTQSEVIEGVDFYRELYNYYPNSYFILNTRDKAGWLKSRQNHGAGNYMRRYQLGLGLPDVDAVLDYWKRQWDRHHARLQDFFADKPDRLVVFDIKQDDPQKLVDFLSPDFITQRDLFLHEGLTSEQDPSAYLSNRPARESEA